MSHQPPQRALTSIVATVGPASREPARLRELVDRGVDVFRLNMAHGSTEDHETTLADIRRVSRDAGRPIGILVDLAGPKIRLGRLHSDTVRCEEGELFHLVRGRSSDRDDQLVTDYDPLVDELTAGDRILLADGTVSLSVTGTDGEAVACRVVNGGLIRSRQGVNLPGAKLGLPAMSDEDRDHAVWAARQGIDFVGLSFVRTATEVHDLQDLLRRHDSQAMVVAKIERSEAVTRMQEIVAVADAVMVARGDLGVEIDVAATPAVQKRIIATCREHHKPVIVATQMLDSMQRSRQPTRAEVSDVANAILDGADACMLSGETAIGEYPREAVEMMNRVMLQAETLLPDPPPPSATNPSSDVHPITSAVVFGAGRIAHRLSARLVVIATRSGATAKVKSKQRDRIPTVGVSDSDATLRRMCLLWGITPLAGAPVSNPPELRRFIDRWARDNGRLSRGDRVVFVTGSMVDPHGHNQILVHESE